MNNLENFEISRTEIAPQTAKALRPLAFYSAYLRPFLPEDTLKPYPLRLLMFFGNFGLAIAALLTMKVADPSWPVKLLLGLAMGWAYGSLGFFAHELLHGSVLKSRWWQDRIGLLALSPFFISPTFWRYWHNILHHGNTQAMITDPDAFPTLRVYKHSKFMQFMYPFTPGSRDIRSISYFFFWFSFHTFVAQFYLRSRNSVYDRMNHRNVTIEVTLQILVWGAVYLWMGPSNWLWCFFVPLAIQNYFIMSYIATNHNLSPLTKVNDPLVNSLTVTNHPVLEFFHFNFGYHVEHHIFPTMSPVKAKKVHALIQQHFPNEMKVMTKFEAMKRLYQTARIYKNSTTLMNPKTGATYPTI